jgi:hypothetical protein
MSSPGIVHISMLSITALFLRSFSSSNQLYNTQFMMFMYNIFYKQKNKITFLLILKFVIEYFGNYVTFTDNYFFRSKQRDRILSFILYIFV